MKIVILGGGIGGLTTTIALRKKGFKNIHIYERAPNPRTIGAGLVLWPNVCLILNRLGIFKNLATYGRPLSAMNRYSANGELKRSIPIHQLGFSMDFPALPILRKDLLKVLLTELQMLNVKVNYNCKAVKIDENILKGKGSVYFENREKVDYDILIGADGRTNSIVRKYIHGNNTPNDMEYTNWVGIATFNKPHPFKNIIHDYWGNGERFGIVPVNNRQVYWAGCQGNDRIDNYSETEKNYLNQVFHSWHNPIKDILKNACETDIKKIAVFDHNPIEKWSTKSVCLLGDAAHAVPPTSGQGAGLAIEDAWCLSHCLKQYESDPTMAFNAYQEDRIPKCTAVLKTGRKLAKEIFRKNIER